MLIGRKMAGEGGDQFVEREPVSESKGREGAHSSLCGGSGKDAPS